MSWATFHNRRCAQIENEHIRVTVSQEGGHIAELLHKGSGVNPLWIPPWPSIEPSSWSAEKHPEYGADAESHLLAGILGHNLCLDLFGSPSPEEAAAGISVHGEASIVPYELTFTDREMTAECLLPAAQLRFRRHMRLDGRHVRISETVENVSVLDRPIGWTQHVTLGPPFLEKGSTQFRAPGTKVLSLGASQGYDWPMKPQAGGGHEDLRICSNAAASGGFESVLMDPHQDRAYFFAWSPRTKVLIGYVWTRSDFPWLGIWDENMSREHPPWNRRALTRGMEFGASPVPESRRKMIDRHSLFGMPGYRWIPARTTARVAYYAFVTTANSIPESLQELQVDVPA